MITLVVNSDDKAILQDMETLGEFIKRRREELGYDTQIRFANDTGVNRAHLSQIESGKIALPNADLRRRIAKGLGITHLELLMASGEISREEVNLPADPRSDAVRRLQPRIDRVAWHDMTYQTIEGMLDLLADPVEATRE